ncbi:arylamine N-acetyltransferase family protein [Fodinibius halophilus]|uniref:Arylamine N-acetyltransferase n=1 Tax=Fodinibius halophilus TaxID=1736908 RepID=A0A6M1T531_9BACT|nr:arylamine N-acetyltransferase [Fodinibius halophilus]NGP87783.1 arylamine N-acetyltransferase [Fodinibius halophilus]
MSSSIDLDKYFQRINYDGSTTHSLATLKALQYRHTQAIPFENLNPLLGISVNLDLESLQAKMVDNKRGGYCYEQNLLFKHVLEELGFQVKGLSARIRWQKDADEITARTHMLLQVNIDNDRYLVDVGFGNYTMTGPLRLETEIIQETPHEERRLIKEGDIYTMQVQLKDKWEPLYRFDLRPTHLVDYELKSWYLSNNPGSHYVTGLTAARPTPNGRYTLKNNRLSFHHLDGNTENNYLNTVAELQSILEDIFLLDLPDLPTFDSKFLQIVKQEKEAISRM